MKLSIFATIAVIILCLWGFVNATWKSQNQKQRLRQQGRGQEHTEGATLSKSLHRNTAKREETKSCILMEAVYLFEEGHKPSEERGREEWRCEFADDDYAVKALEGLPTHFFPVHQDSIESGRTVLKVTYPSDIPIETVYTDDAFLIPDGAKVELENTRDYGFRHRRTMIEKQGNHTILAIRVTDIDGSAPLKSADDLRDDIFGMIGNDLHNLRSQYLACSGGKLDFVPGEGPKVDRGVADLELPISIAEKSSSVVENWVTRYAPKVLGDMSSWDLVMYILPNSVNFAGAAAYTYVGARHSVFQDKHSSNLIVLMHEVGHNLGMRHSGHGSLSYADGTCMMGAHVYADDAPQMCFNAAKSWYLGWYADRHVVITPSENSREIELVGIDDYLNGQATEKQAVILWVKSTTSNHLFVMFNRKEGVNSQVHKMGDTVTVVEQRQARGQSWLQAGITDFTEPFRYESWNNGDVDLVIEVCEQVRGKPDYARVLVYLDDDSNRLSCAKEGLEIKKVELPIITGEGDYRERSSGFVKKAAMFQFLFAPNWRLHGLRFESTVGHRIPSDAHILSAEVLVDPGEVEQYGQMDGYAVGNANGNPSTANGRFWISKAPKTKAEAPIDPNLPAWNPGGYNSLVEVGPIVQEIVGRIDYKEGNPIEIFLVGNGGGGTRKFKTANSGSGPKLRVTYTVPSKINISTAKAQSDEQRKDKEIVVNVATSRDDFREASKGSIGTGSKTHTMFASSSVRQGYRFQQVPVPQGATILEARLEMVGKSTNTLRRDISGVIQGENVGNAAAFRYKKFQLLHAPKTESMVEIRNPPAWVAEQYNSLGDVSVIIQEIVDREDYEYGNAIKFIISDQDTASAGRRVKTFDGGSPARLVVRYRL